MLANRLYLLIFNTEIVLNYLVMTQVTDCSCISDSILAELFITESAVQF